MSVQSLRMSGVATAAMLTLSVAACQSGGEAARAEPANLVANVAAGAHGVSLRWDGVPGTSYEVFRGTKASGVGESPVAVVGVSTYDDTGDDLAADSDYVYRVSARSPGHHETVPPATVRVHTPADPSCAVVCARIVACLGGHGGAYGGGYGDCGSYGAYGSGYGEYGSYGGGYGEYGSYGGGYGEYGSGYGDCGSYGDYGSYGNGYGGYGGGYGVSGTTAACLSSCQALPARARRKIVACIGSRSSCPETLACE